MVPGVPAQAFPTRSPPSHPISPSLCSQQQPLPWGCSTIPKLQLPTALPSRGPVSLSVVCDCGKDCLILIPFRPPQISCFTLTLKYFSSDPDSCSHVGIGHRLQFSHLLRAGPGLLTLLFFPLVLSSYQILWFYIFLSTGHVLLSGLSWCSASISVSEGVFLMYLWRETYSMSSYCSAILFISTF